jgi:allantoin racemase
MKNIRVVTPLTAAGYRHPDDFKHLETETLRITYSQVAHGPESIEGRFDEALCIPPAIGKIIEAEREGADAVVIDCLGDPGVEEGRECVSIPVVGPLETSSHIASMLAYKFSIVTVFDEVIPFFEGLVRKFALQDKLASVRGLNIPVLELSTDPDRTLQRMIEESVRAIREDGAHAIVFGCSGIDCTNELRDALSQRGFDVPVIEPMPVAIKLAASLVDLGLRHSGRTYARPRPKSIRGYDYIGAAQ